MCAVPSCRRTPPIRSLLCGACAALVPVETKLALEGHDEAYLRPWHWAGWDGTADDVAAMRAFIRFSRVAVMDLAIQQAHEAREQRWKDRMATMWDE